MTRKFQSNNRVVPAILAILDRDGETTVAEIHDELGTTVRYVQATLNKMMEAGLVHVARHERLRPGSGKPARVFALGAKPNAKPPKPTPKQRREYMNAWQRERRAQKSIMARAQHMGVFGVVAAQL